MSSYSNFCVKARSCENPPPEPYLGMDLIWPKKSIELGSKIAYSCPYRTGTKTHELKRKISQVSCYCNEKVLSQSRAICQLHLGQGH